VTRETKLFRHERRIVCDGKNILTGFGDAPEMTLGNGIRLASGLELLAVTQVEMEGFSVGGDRIAL